MIRFAGVLLAMIFLSFFASGQERQFKNEFGFRSDNDAYLFYGQDRYYTNGLFIYFRHAVDQDKLAGKTEKSILEFTAGQQMFNPVSGFSPDPAKQDRPFAGYLYAGGSLTKFFKNETVLKGEMQIGTVGPSSLAEDAQELLHDLVGFYKLEGWEYQVRDEFAVNLKARYLNLIRRAANNKTDLTFDGSVNLGSTYSSAAAGLLFRTGRVNQIFHSAVLNASISNHSKTARLVKNELFFYAMPQLTFVAYDATIQGSMFKNNSPVTFGVKPLVFSQLIGFNYSTPRFTIDYRLIFKSKEVKSNARPHQFGSISMYYRFN